jgi:hypothetical protein
VSLSATRFARISLTLLSLRLSVTRLVS